MEKSVLITHANNEHDSAEYDHSISVEELLTQIPRDEFLDVIQRVSSLDVPNTGCIAFSIVWQRFTGSQNNNLVRAILFSQQLNRHLDKLDIDRGTLVCGESLEESYVRAVEDVAKTTSLETTRLGWKRSLATLSVLIQMIVVTIKSGVVISDWVIARLAALFTDPVEKSTVYVPPIERLNSSLPAIEALSKRPQTVITEPLWYYSLQSSIKSKLKPYNPTFSDQYLSVRGFLGQIRDLGTILEEVLTVNSFAPALTAAVEEEFGVRIESSINGAVREHLSNLLVVRALVARRSFRSIFAADYVEKVVMGTLDPMGRAIVEEATRQQVQTYHIPHSIATTTPPYPKTEVVQFVSGDWDIAYYEQVVPRERQWRWVKTGRPYLSTIAEQHGGKKDSARADSTEQRQFDVLLATQPHSPTVRREFVKTMLTRLNSDKFKLTVKPHPDEDTSLYRDLASKYENLRIIVDDLYEMISESDITITINSNVGLESIVVGTPVICFNAWEPFLFEQTYATAEEIPLLKSSDELQAFANRIDDNELYKLQRQQYTFVKENYCIDSDAAAKIATKIESDSLAT